MDPFTVIERVLVAFDAEMVSTFRVLVVFCMDVQLDDGVYWKVIWIKSLTFIFNNKGINVAAAFNISICSLESEASYSVLRTNR